MNMLKTINNINIRYNRFKKNTRFDSSPIKSFNFKKGLKSIDLSQEHFINKASKPEEKGYDAVTDMYLQHLENDYSFIDDFLSDELLFDFKAERLLRILNAVQKTKYKKTDLKSIFKMKNKNNPELHFYIKKSRDNYSVLLIDLYHLGIYGDKILPNGKRVPISLESIYKSKKNNCYDLEKIKELS